MGELGTESDKGHREVGECAATLRIDHLITIGAQGELMARAASDAGLKDVADAGSTTEAAELLGEICSAGDLVLVKGSRTARTERVIEEFSRRQPAVSN